MKKWILFFVLGVIFSQQSYAANEELYLNGPAGARVSGTTGTMTWALNNVTPTVASSSIDLTAYTGFFVQVTGKAGAQVSVQFSNLTYTPYVEKFVLLPGNAHVIEKWANHVKFVSKAGAAADAKVSVFYERLGAVTLSLAAGSTVAATQSGTWNLGTAGNVSLNAGTNTIGAVGITGSAHVGLTETAALLKAPGTLVSITLTGSTSWTNTPVTCTARPCNILFWNQSPTETLLWWLDQTTTSPVFSGISATAGSDPLQLDTVPGDVFHYRYSASTGNGFLQNRSAP